MGVQVPARYAWPIAAVLFVSAGLVGVSRMRASLPEGKPAVPKPSMVPMSFPAVPPGDRVEADPAPAAAAEVAKWVAQLSAPAPETQDRAALAIEFLPYLDLPLLEATAARPDLPSLAGDRLAGLMPRIRARDKLARRRAHAMDASGDFYEAQALSGYARGGHTDAKWDAAAQTFLHLANVRYVLHRPAAMAADIAEARRQLKLAVDAGCDDPTVFACAGLFVDDQGATRDEVADWFARADRQSGAGPLFRGIIDGRLLRAAAELNDAERRRTSPALMHRLDDMQQQFKDLLATPGVPPSVAVAVASNMFDRARDAHASVQSYVECTQSLLDKAFPNEPAALALKGKAYIRWAWQARGTGWASSVTPQGWKDFAARLATAEASLTEAWQRDPDDPDPAVQMITVLMGQQGGRNEMQTWYRRAMDADPDDVDAAYAKLTFLEPKWGGDPASMIRFGRQCVTEGNWRSNLPTLLAEAHARLAGYVSDPAYWLQPGVWDDVRSVYAGYVDRYPGQDRYRNRLAHFAVLCHQWKAADEQFRRLGTQADASQFGNGTPAAVDEARRTAARLADVADAQGR